MSYEIPVIVNNNGNGDPQNKGNSFSTMHSQNVTPDLAKEDSHKRRRYENDSSSNPVKRKLLYDDNLDNCCTQVMDYTQQSQTVEEAMESYYLVDTRGNQAIPLEESVTCGEVDKSNCTVYPITRDLLKSIHVEPNHGAIGRDHAKLLFDPVTRTFQLQADQNPCWILNGPKWVHLEPGETASLEFNQRFRLLPPSNRIGYQYKGVQFSVSKCHTLGNQIQNGSGSFDHEYLQLLRCIKAYGQEQCNKKGPSWTLQDQYTLTIDLYSPEDKNLLPVTTLRNLWAGQKALVEALWYIRGERHIDFLKKHKCRFWDAQAERDGFVGLNYGLLTNFPIDNNGESYNQLLSKVIEPLCQGKCSRNMLCSLSNPGERTVQEACTSGVQFAVADGKRLDLTINQRSSDVILGLPHDVIVWSIILHLVRREVFRRSGRHLAAGTLHFAIAAGGAHVYTINEGSFSELLSRTPIQEVQPHMVVETDKNIFELASNYERQDVLIPGYTKKHPSIKIEQAKQN